MACCVLCGAHGRKYMEPWANAGHEAYLNTIITVAPSPPRGYSRVPRIMASKYTPETNTMPHLVVKIVGSKQVKYFVEGPNKGAVSNEQVADDPTAAESVPGEESLHSQKTTVPPSPLSANKVNEDLRIYMELQKMCDRQCVTAPCGDRSLSYIHVKKKLSLSAVTDLHKATQPQEQEPPSTRHQEGDLKEKGRELEEKEAEEKELLWLIREELMAGGGWGGGDGGGGDGDGDGGGGGGAILMENLEHDVLELDCSGEGSLHQSQLSYALLRHRLPLTLPTLARLLHAFAKDNSPNEVGYGKLLQFLRAAVENNQTEEKQVNGGSNSGSRTSQSARRPSDLSSAPTNGGPRGRWVDRFQEMEKALNLCDTQNTGFLDKDKARRLIQNYNVILDLSLSPVKIAEATRTARTTEGKIHLASTLQRLRGL